MSARERRLSVDHPKPRRDIATLGEALMWRGGLTLDYLHEHGNPSYIECNPRTAEPGNATASGVNLPDLQVRLTLGEPLASPPQTGRTGVRTHGTIALVLGAAAYGGTRRAVTAQLARALGFVVAQALASPRRATAVAGKAIGRYAITQDTIDSLAAATGRSPPR